MPSLKPFFDPLYLLLVLPFAGLAFWASSRVKGTFAKYSRVPIRSQFTGADTARAILKGAGIHDVSIERVSGMLSDHYDPRPKRFEFPFDRMAGNDIHGC